MCTCLCSLRKQDRPSPSLIAQADAGKDASSAHRPPTSVAVVVVHHEWRVDSPRARVTLWNRQQLTWGESKWHGALGLAR